MSINLDKVFVKEFSTQVINEFQASGKLRNTVRRVTGVVGSSYVWEVSGQGMAQQKAAQEDVKLMDIDYRPVEVFLQDWHASELTDKFKKQKINFDEQTNLSKVVAKAMSRREDQMILDALAASGTTNVIPAGNTNLTLAKLIAASAIFNDTDVDGTRHFAITASALGALLNDKTITSADYNTIRALMTGELNTFMGFKFHLISTRKEGGLPKTGDIRDCYMWTEEAVGEAVGIDMQILMDWVPMKTSHLITGCFSANAKVIQPSGVVKVQINESVVFTS